MQHNNWCIICDRESYIECGTSPVEIQTCFHIDQIRFFPIFDQKIGKLLFAKSATRCCRIPQVSLSSRYRTPKIMIVQAITFISNHIYQQPYLFAITFISNHIYKQPWTPPSSSKASSPSQSYSSPLPQSSPSPVCGQAEGDC